VEVVAQVREEEGANCEGEKMGVAVLRGYSFFGKMIGSDDAGNYRACVWGDWSVVLRLGPRAVGKRDWGQAASNVGHTRGIGMGWVAVVAGRCSRGSRAYQ
jgi:hypothetical protein